MAFVLPATILTGSRWASVRQMLLDEFDVDWVVVCHDSRNRSARGGFPGRRFVAFSESTRIAETLIVATKRPSARNPDQTHFVRFVNLRRNPEEPNQCTRDHASVAGSGVLARLTSKGNWRTRHRNFHVPITNLSNLCELGPYHMQVKNEKYGLFQR